MSGLHARPAAACWLLALAAGCASDGSNGSTLRRVDLDGDGVRQTVPALRVVISGDGKTPYGGSLLKAAENTPEAVADLFAFTTDQEEPIEPFFGGELEYAATFGDFHQTLRAGERIDLHETKDIVVPGEMETRYHLQLFSGVVRTGVSIHDVLVLDVGGGLHLQGMHMNVEGADGRDSTERHWRFGVTLAGGAAVKPVADFLVAYGRGAVHLGLFDSVITTGEVGLQLSLFPGIAVFGGIRWTQYVLERDSGDHEDSDYEVDAWGPAFGLALSF